MDSPVDEVLKGILQEQPILHGAGALSSAALKAMARHLGGRSVRRSVETGCGATTLLLSHLSEHHTVFALDIGRSVENVRRSPLLKKEVVSFVEGPSQRTLPQHTFDEKLQFALIDGPHGYPFPDLEYYFIYPHLDSGALFVLDDIQIRTIHNLFEFLRRDEMFRLEEVVRTTAFFTRTGAPTLDPFGDSWQQQRYNTRTLLRYDWRSKLISALPRSVVRKLAARRYGAARGHKQCSVEISSPGRSQPVGHASSVCGRATVCAGAHLWVLARRKDVNGWWPQGEGPVAVIDGRWSVQATYGGPEDAGFPFELAAVIVSQPVHESWLKWVTDVRHTGVFPPVQLPRAPHVVAESFRTVHRKRP